MIALTRAWAAGVLVSFVGAAVAQTQLPDYGTIASVPKDAKALLADARAAVAKLHALSYSARISGSGSMAGLVQAQAADVSASRADAGGWKLAAKGSKQGGDAGKNAKFEIGYDGVTARALHESDKVVMEKTVEEWQDLPPFFAAESASPVVAWEILDEKPLEIGDRGAAFTGQEVVAAELCDVLLIGKADDHGTKVYLNQADHLPRRIERFESAPGAAPGAVRLDLDNLKLDEESLAGIYNISAPDGYAIRVAKREKPKASAGDEAGGQKLGDPDDTRGHLAKRGQVNVGDMAPAFSLKDPAGNVVTLASLKGKVVVIDFWGTWCPWCVKAMPQVQQVHDKFKGKDVAVLGFDVDAPNAKPVEFMKRNKLTYTTLLNADNAAQDFKVEGFPTLFVLDRSGKVILKEVGFSPDLAAKVSKAVESALGNQ